MKGVELQKNHKTEERRAKVSRAVMEFLRESE